MGRARPRAPAIALALCLAGCQGAPEGGAAAAASGAGGRAAIAPALRRPTRRYYLARARDRCEVYSVDGDAVSPPFSVPCPPDLAREERIRIAGKTCARESPADPAREVPVVCPDALTNLEKYDLGERDAWP